MNQNEKPASRLLTDKTAITTILQIAKTHLWQFAFYRPDQASGSPFTTELLRVDEDKGVIVFGPEVNSLVSKSPRTVRFRANSGGISVQFDTHILPEPSERPNAHLFASTCRVAFPGKMIYLQRRQTVRVNFTDMAQIPITLFTSDGKTISGEVEDISETGVKARFAGYLVEKLEADQLIADCGLILPDRSEIQGEVQVLGTLYDFQEDVSFVRCSFRRMSGNAPLRIRALIEQAIKRADRIRPA